MSFIRLIPSLSCRLPGPPPTSETISHLRWLLYFPRQPASQSACRKLSRACAHSDTLQPLIVPSCCVAVATATVRMSRLSQLIADTTARAVSRAALRAARIHRSPVRRDGLHALLWQRLPRHRPHAMYWCTVSEFWKINICHRTSAH